MSDTNDTPVTPEAKRLGMLAQFAGPDELIAAAERVTDDGYKKVDAYSPFAVIGIDEALKTKGTILPWVVLVMGLTGLFAGLGMQLYMNGVEFPGAPWGLSGYDFQISGKPGFSSVPAFIPVTFEVIVLLSAFGSFFGMLILNKLPRLSNPLFRNERFADATTDGFFLFVESDDPKYADAETGAYLSSIGASAVEAIDDIPTGHAVPGLIYMIGAAVACVALLPPLYIWTTSSTTSTVDRVDFLKDMEHQAKFKAQTTSGLFGDGRAARKAVPGTVARGSGKDDMPLYYGVEPDSNLAEMLRRGDLTFASFNDSARVPARFASDDQPPAEDADSQGAEEETSEEPAEPNWTKEFPASLKLDEAFMDRGEKCFNINCAACHGLAGNGDGLVSQRATKVSGASWAPPTSLHVASVLEQPVGRIFDTISNGRRKMPGYRRQLSPEDRWAVVFYVKALQRSQNATEADVPADKRMELKGRN